MASQDDMAIRVEGVSKSFKLPHEKQSSLKGQFVSMFRGKKTYEKQRVLNNVSFDVKRGEFFGIVGRNGSGKSTLLKLLAGIYTPDKGAIQINGKLTPFIELGVGFNPELTGRENVFLNGALLGFKRSEIDAMYDEIVDFAELRRFMDQKLKNYSSGMQVRLAFSIAIKADTPILILDEVLAVGDAEFQQKCNDYFYKFKQEGKTVILVTHDMDAVKRMCTKALLLEKGKIKTIGAPNEVANQYTLDNIEAGSESRKNEELSSSVKKLDVKVLSSLSPKDSDEFRFEISYILNEDILVDLAMSLSHDGKSIVEQNTKGLKLGHVPGKKYRVEFALPLDSYISKTFSVDVAIFKSKGFRLIGHCSNACTFTVASTSKLKGGLLKTRGSWIVK